MHARPAFDECSPNYDRSYWLTDPKHRRRRSKAGAAGSVLQRNPGVDRGRDATGVVDPAQLEAENAQLRQRVAELTLEIHKLREKRKR
jgi:cell division protein FtsB